MATLASSLLDFILDLLRDPETAAEFEADPEGTLALAGLDDVCPADVASLRLVLEDGAPMGVGPSGLAHVPSVAQAAAPGFAAVTPQVVATTTQVSPATSAADSDSDSVVEQLRYIQQTFTYNANTTVDVRDSVWAGKDVYQLFGDDSVMSAPGSIAAGRDIEDVELDIEDSFSPVTTTVEGDGNAVGEDNEVENTDKSVRVDDSNGTYVGDNGEVGDVTTGNGNVVGNDLDVDVRDSGNDNSRTDNSTDVDIRDSGNDNSRTDNSTDVDVDLDDSFNDNSDNSDRSVSDDDEYEFEDNTVVTGDGSAADGATVAPEDNDTFVSDVLNDNVVVAGNDDNNLAGDDVND
jgi:hypothetical protein